MLARRVQRQLGARSAGSRSSSRRDHFCAQGPTGAVAHHAYGMTARSLRRTSHADLELSPVFWCAKHDFARPVANLEGRRGSG